MYIVMSRNVKLCHLEALPIHVILGLHPHLVRSHPPALRRHRLQLGPQEGVQELDGEHQVCHVLILLVDEMISFKVVDIKIFAK